MSQKFGNLWSFIGCSEVNVNEEYINKDLATSKLLNPEAFFSFVYVYIQYTSKFWSSELNEAWSII